MIDETNNEQTIMAGITTSETLRGEQPKDDVLGSRVDKLTVQVQDELRKVDELRKEVALLRCRVTDKFEALEKKNNDE